MKDYQFEEIVFWLSLVACLLAYHSGIKWLVVIIAVISVANCISAITTAWKCTRNQPRKIYAITFIVKMKGWFCCHRWRLVRKDHVYSMRDGRWREVDTYICIKCNKMKVVKVE